MLVGLGPAFGMSRDGLVDEEEENLLEPRRAKPLRCEEREEWKNMRSCLGCDAGGDLTTFGEELRPPSLPTCVRQFAGQSLG
jgi:hypothetical protein